MLYQTQYAKKKDAFCCKISIKLLEGRKHMGHASDYPFASVSLVMYVFLVALNGFSEGI
jgi:hypothetical protein